MISRREDLKDLAAPEQDADLRAVVGEMSEALADLRAVTGDEAIQLSARLRAMEAKLDELADQLGKAPASAAQREKSDYSPEELEALRAAKARAAAEGSDKRKQGKSSSN